MPKPADWKSIALGELLSGPEMDEINEIFDCWIDVSDGRCAADLKEYLNQPERRARLLKKEVLPEFLAYYLQYMKMEHKL